MRTGQRHGQVRTILGEIMGRERRFKGTESEIALARFLCEVTDSLGLDTVDKVAERFPQGGSRSKWAEYLNGAKRIDKPLLRDVLRELRRTKPDHWSGNLLIEANRLWKAAAAGAPPPPGSSNAELVSLYRQLHETTEALMKAQAVAVNSARVIPLLLQYAGLQETRIADLTREVEHLRAQDRAKASHRLEQARLRRSRVQSELTRARNDRHTAEQAQTALLRRQQQARQAIAQLQRPVPDPEQTTAEPALLLERRPEPERSDEEVDQEMDAQLDLIHTDGEQRKELLFEVLEQADAEHTDAEPAPDASAHRTIPGTVVAPEPDHQPGPAPRPVPDPQESAPALSRTTPDSSATSNNAHPRQQSTSTRERSRFRRVRRVLIPLLAASFAVVLAARGDYSCGAHDKNASPPRPTPTETAHDKTDKDSAPSSSSSELPSRVPKDPVADIGDVEINTPEIMKLPPCRDRPSPFSASVKPTPDDPARFGRKVSLAVTIKSPNSETCRYNLNRKWNTILLHRADKDTDSKIWGKDGYWNSAFCNDGAHDSDLDLPDRWAKLDASHPLTMVFPWDFEKTLQECVTPARKFNKSGRYHYEFTPALGAVSIDGDSGHFYVTAQ